MKKIMLVALTGIVALFFIHGFAGRSVVSAQPDAKLDDDKIGTAAGTKATTTPYGVVRRLH